MNDTERAQIARIVREYGIDGDRWTVVPIDIGLINKTYRVDVGSTRRVLQRLHPIFAPSVNDDIETITSHLERRGMTTPRLVPANTGALFVADEEGATWRMLTYLDGRVYTKVTEPWMARGAGEIAGAFHNAVADLEHDFAFARAGVHDTPAHLTKLERALVEKADHAAFATVEPVARAILHHASELPPLPESPRRIIHGDLKISNVMFRPDADAPLALLDLDTMATSSVAIEMGDAFRSWCNPAGESDTTARIDAEIFAGAMTAYAASVGGLLVDVEKRSLVIATETIALELAARFCADALLENYFGWDPQRFASRSEHNRARAAAQLAVARSARGQRQRLEAIARDAFARA